jgi:hypothetical protein
VTTPLSEAVVLQACRTLFGTEINVCRGFLSYLQPDGARSAFRKIAKETHPDFFARDTLYVQKYQTELFQKILSAYEILNAFFKQRDEGSWGLRSGTFDTGIYRRRTYWRHAEKTGGRRQEKNGSGTFSGGPLPFRCLELGHYLYYQGMISYEALISALVWQRRQRPVVGDIALRWGWLNAPAIDRILGAMNLRGRFGDRAVALGLLSIFQVNTLLYYQRSQQERLGQYFVKNRILSPEKLERVVRELHEHNAAVRCDLSRREQMRSARA